MIDFGVPKKYRIRDKVLIDGYLHTLGANVGKLEAIVMKDTLIDTDRMVCTFLDRSKRRSALRQFKFDVVYYNFSRKEEPFNVLNKIMRDAVQRGKYIGESWDDQW